MKNSTLVRIKVPKALYESALRKALLEASDKATPEKVKASIQKQEKDHNKKTDDMIAKARAAKAKTGVKEARHISDFITLKPGREISKDTQHLGEKKKHVEESSLMQTFQSLKDLTPFLIPLAGFLGLSVAIVKNMFKYMKDNNLKGMKGFIEAYNTVGKGVSGTMDQSKGIQNESKIEQTAQYKSDMKIKKLAAEKKAAAEKKKADAETAQEKSDKKAKEAAAEKKALAAAKKKVEDAKKK